MSNARIAVSLDKILVRAIRKAAGKEATSAWIADAAKRKLRSQGLLEVISEWESKHGELSKTELKAAARLQHRRNT
jgi:hypothetical protein